MRVPLGLIAAVLAASPALGSEMVVFKKESSYRGAAMRVASHEERDGRLVLRTDAGEVFSVPLDSVDWEQSARVTAELRRRESERAEERAAEERARLQREASRRTQDLTLLEASRRYGTDKAGLSVPQGTAVRDTAPFAEASPAAPAAGGTAAPGADESPQAAAARQRLEAARAEREEVEAALKKERADTNPDPVWAAARRARIQTLEARAAQIDRRIETLQRELEAAVAAGAPAGGETAPGTATPAR